MTTRRRALALLVLEAVTVAAAAGCGSDERTTTSTAATAGAVTVVPAKPASATPGTVAAEPGYAAGTRVISLAVGGVTRTAVLAVPPDLSHPAPLVLAFHGHSGSGKNFDKKMDIEGLWRDAVVVYPDGLVGHSGKTDPDGRETGWQTVAGETGDEDLAFYDALVADLQAKLPIDGNRIYAAGHSNGSAFVSLLLNVRGTSIAATANLSGQAGRYLETDPVRSMFMSMGRSDPIVSYDNQRKSVPLAEQKIGADPAPAVVDGLLTTEQGRGDLELAVYDYPGGHDVPVEVPPLIVAFFQRHTLAGG